MESDSGLRRLDLIRYGIGSDLFQKTSENECEKERVLAGSVVCGAFPFVFCADECEAGTGGEGLGPDVG